MDDDEDIRQTRKMEAARAPSLPPPPPPPFPMAFHQQADEVQWRYAFAHRLRGLERLVSVVLVVVGFALIVEIVVLVGMVNGVR